MNISNKELKSLSIISRNYLLRDMLCNCKLKSLVTLFFLNTFLLLVISPSEAQNITLLTNKKQQDYIDSLKSMDYPHKFPIWGEKTYHAGFDIPYPAGIMGNFFYQYQNVIISELEVGFEGPDNTIDPIPLDSIVTFAKTTAETYAFNIRPDLWILPFWSVYGIFAFGKNSTHVELAEPVPVVAITDFDALAAGFGTNVSGGLGPGWFNIDYNTSWSFIDALDKPVRFNNFSFRFGSTFVFKEKPYKNLAIWVGGFRQRMEQNTSGRISFGDIFPDPDNGLADKLDDWYDGWSEENCSAPPPNPICEPLGELVAAITDNLRSNEPITDTDITYKLKKEVKQEWNMIVGAQYQFNKRFQVRSEAGVVGDRRSFLLSFNYRFLL